MVAASAAGAESNCGAESAAVAAVSTARRVGAQACGASSAAAASSVTIIARFVGEEDATIAATLFIHTSSCALLRRPSLAQMLAVP